MTNFALRSWKKVQYLKANSTVLRQQEIGPETLQVKSQHKKFVPEYSSEVALSWPVIHIRQSEHTFKLIYYC